MKHSRHIFITYILFFFIFCGCQNKNADAINVIPLKDALVLSNSEEILLSKYASDIDYIALAADSSVMLPGPESLKLRAVGDDILLCREMMSSKSPACFRFSSDGVFLNGIGTTGNGPGEYARLMNDISLSVHQKEQIDVFDGGKLITFDLEGNCISEKRKSEFTDEEREIYAIGKNKPNIYSYYKIPSITNVGSDTVRSINGEVRYIFDFGNYSATLPKDRKVMLRASTYAETDGFILFETLYFFKAFPNLSKRQMVCEMVYDKITGKTTAIKTEESLPLDGFTNDLDNGVPFWPSLTTQNKMYQLVDAITFIDWAGQFNSPKMKEVASKLTEESNPVLIVVTLK
ncbi:MAG: 6-bladed beta-propeller [Bacteroidales bacterium]|nr:6-bladed beta-propeller [Bacteroidales bacterium]